MYKFVLLRVKLDWFLIGISLIIFEELMQGSICLKKRYEQMIETIIFFIAFYLDTITLILKYQNIYFIILYFWYRIILNS